MTNIISVPCGSMNGPMSGYDVFLGYFYYRYELDFKQAEKYFLKTLKLSHANAEAHQYYAMFLHTQDRQSQALTEVKKALELDPLSLPINNIMATAYYFIGEYDLALEKQIKPWKLIPPIDQRMRQKDGYIIIRVI